MSNWMSCSHVWPQRILLQFLGSTMYNVLRVIPLGFRVLSSRFSPASPVSSLPILSLTWMLIFSHDLFLSLRSSHWSALIQPPKLSSVWFSLPNYRTESPAISWTLQAAAAQASCISNKSYPPPPSVYLPVFLSQEGTSWVLRCGASISD